jgi:hypothetical protein
MQHVRSGKRGPAAEAVADDPDWRRFEPHVGQDILEQKAHVWHAARNDRLSSRRPLFWTFALSKAELGYDELGVIQSRDDVAMAGQVIRQERVGAPTAAAARVREKDYRAHPDRFRWIPDAAWEAAVADGIECLHGPLADSESALEKRVVHFWRFSETR